MFHPDTQQLLEQLVARLPQSLLLIGRAGVSLTEAARTLTEGSLDVRSITPDTSKATPVISVEAIRELYQQTKNKSEARQYIIITDADRMTHAAQAAFLKLLEEPQKAVHFILTSHSPSHLLSTIRSRTQAHHIAPVTREQSVAYIQQLDVSDQQTIAQLLYLAEGLPEELYRLITDQTYFAQAAEITKDARSFLQAATYQQLVTAHRYSKDRQKAVSLVRSATRLTEKSLRANPQPAHVDTLKKLLKTEEYLAANTNVKLALMYFVL